MAHFSNIQAITECPNKQRNVTNTRLLYPAQPEIPALDFSTPLQLQRSWRREMETKNIFPERARKDACKPHTCFFYSVNCEGGSSRTHKNVANTSNPVNYLVLVRCKFCMNYRMVVQETRACSNCSGVLVNFEQERCF